MACVAYKAAAASESSHSGEATCETEGTSFPAKGKKKRIRHCKLKTYIVTNIMLSFVKSSVNDLASVEGKTCS